MAKGAYIGTSGTAKKIKKLYVGINGTAKKVKRAYIGVGGVAKLWWAGGGGQTLLYGDVTAAGATAIYSSPDDPATSYTALETPPAKFQYILFDEANNRFIGLIGENYYITAYSMPVGGTTWTLIIKSVYIYSGPLSSSIARPFVKDNYIYFYNSGGANYNRMSLADGSVSAFQQWTPSVYQVMDILNYANGYFIGMLGYGNQYGKSYYIAYTTGINAAWSVRSLWDASTSDYWNVHFGGTYAQGRNNYKPAIWYENGNYYLVRWLSSAVYVLKGTTFNNLTQVASYNIYSVAGQYANLIDYIFGGLMIAGSNGTYICSVDSTSSSQISTGDASINGWFRDTWKTGNTMYVTYQVGTSPNTKTYLKYNKGGNWTVIEITSFSGYSIYHLASSIKD